MLMCVCVYIYIYKALIYIYIYISIYLYIYIYKALLLKYIRLPIPFFKYTFNFSQTVGEMVFVSFEVEKMRMFLVQSIVRWCVVLVQSWGAVVYFPV